MNIDDTENESKEPEMGFFDHFGELRIRIIWSLVSVAITCIIASFFYDFFIEKILIAPASNAKLKLQNLQPFGQVYLSFKIILFLGVVMALPIILYQIWKFISPALYANEKGWAKGIGFFTVLCFLSGITFSYYVLIPSMLQFASDYKFENIENQIDINYYWSFIIMIILSSGIFFQLPVVSYILSRIGILTPVFLRRYRRHSIVIILIIAAIITPSPDPINQLIVAIPIYILYEISILVSFIAIKKYLKNKRI